MFVGHFGVGFGAKKAAPSLSLGTLFIASQFIDLLWPIFILLGVEKVQISLDPANTPHLDFIYYPYSHSLMMVVIWGLLFGLVYWIIKRNKLNSLILGACVVSHWLLDLVVHRPDLPLLPGNTMKAGFALWDDKFISLVVEMLIYLVGFYCYVISTRPVNKTGRYVLVFLFLFLLFSHLMNTFGAPPPDVRSMAMVSMLQWVFVGLAYWADRNREPAKTLHALHENF